jgi:hypothetical protein
MGKSRFCNICSKPIDQNVLWGWMKMALCNAYLFLFCLPVTDTVEPAVSQYNATSSPEKLILL